MGPPKASNRSRVTACAGAWTDRQVVLGNRKLLDDLGVDLRMDRGALAERAETLRADGQTVMFVVVENKVAGLLAVADPIKQSTPEAIDQLHKDGMRIVMLTGDSRTTAEAVARRLGIDEVIAEVLPERKADVVKTSAGRRPLRGHGGRWNQRCSSAGAGSGGHRHGHGHGCGHGERRRDAGAGETCEALSEHGC